MSVYLDWFSQIGQNFKISQFKCMDMKAIETVVLEQKEEFSANLDCEWCSRPEENLELVEEYKIKSSQIENSLST